VTALPAAVTSPPPSAAAPEIVIEVEGLTKSFNGRTVVKGLTMQVRKGLIYGFLGPNGSGKTTTIRMLCGLLTPDSGRGTCLGYDILTQSAAIERLGLGNRADQLAGELSGGWKQRLALGACILPSPQLLLLDEPTAGVDPKARRDFWDEIHALAHEGLTVLVSTHYMDEAERCHEIAYIAYGELLAQGTVEEVVENAHLATYTVTGPDLAGLAARLRQTPGVDMVAPFGTALHVSGRDAGKLESAIAPLRESGAQQWRRDAPTLEDVFIDLMSRSTDNFG
jgi:ABC-2 type transport system ATP-binding protein